MVSFFLCQRIVFLSRACITPSHAILGQKGEMRSPPLPFFFFLPFFLLLTPNAPKRTPLFFWAGISFHFIFHTVMVYKPSHARLAGRIFFPPPKNICMFFWCVCFLQEGEGYYLGAWAGAGAERAPPLNLALSSSVSV